MYLYIYIYIEDLDIDLDIDIGIYFFSCLHMQYSIRFATRTAHTQEIGWGGKKRAYLAQQKADWGQTWRSSALT